jgi:hypothetical protein
MSRDSNKPDDLGWIIRLVTLLIVVLERVLLDHDSWRL